MKLFRRSGVPWWRQVTLLEVLVFTLPPLALVLWLFGSAVLDYHRIRQFDDWWSNATSVRKFGWLRARTALRALELGALGERLSAEREDVPQLRLLAKRSDWDRIDSDVGEHWGEWIDVQLLDHGEYKDAKLRFRGDGSAHWTTEKKSFTLKTKRDELFKGFRTLAFSVKDVLPQYLAGSLAAEFDLLAPEQQIVPVFLNDRFYGVHRFVEPIDESFLRRHDRLPGNVFRADTAERGDYFKGLPREVFVNPYIWDRVAMNDRPGASGTAALFEFIADLNTSTLEEHERFMAHFERAELSRLLAFLLVCGDPYHMSGVHNQFWYEDPSDAKLHPVVWDVRLLELGKPPTGSNINRFWRAVLKDRLIWIGAMREVAKWLEGDKLYKLAEERVNTAWTRFHDAFEYDTLRAGVIPPVGDPATTLATLRKNLDTLQTWVEDCRVAVSWEPSASNVHTLVLDLVTSGRADAQFSALVIECRPGTTSSKPTRMFFDGNENGVLDPDDHDLGNGARVKDCRVELTVNNRLPAVCGGSGSALEPVPTAFRFFLDLGDLSASDVTAIRCTIGNAILYSMMLPSQPFVASNDLVFGAALPAHRWGAPWHLPISAPATLSGQVHLSSDLVVGWRSPLTIEAGTTITLAPNVSLLIKGKAEFRGTEAAPITIQRSNPDLPWGVIALQGAGANGSSFRHVKFLGGGGARLENVEYTGSVCVHDAFGVLFDHCEFAGNSRCDDLLHLDRGDAAITNSHFHDANADSIDYDMSTGLIAYNTIERSGNDGLDLMTCTPRIIGNRILNSADKGISIGEDSAPLVFANTISGCVRGLEVKDRSRPIVLDTSITGCEIGVLADLKNWRYGEAGWPLLVRSSVTGNGTDYSSADGARRTLANALIGNAADALPPGADLEWLLRSQGLRDGPTQPGAGAGETFAIAPPLAPLYEGWFAEDFVAPRDGWAHAPSVSRLVKRGHDLVASLAHERGDIALRADWELSDPSRRYVLVLEVAGQEVTEVAALASSPSGAVGHAVAIDPDPRTYRFTAFDLPPNVYDGLVLSATPQTTSARLNLHSWRIFAWPREGER